MAQREYVDFKLYLTAVPEGKGACQVALLPTPEVGETVTPITVPNKAAPSPELLSFLASKSITWRKLVELGKQLADCLLPEGDIRNLFEDVYRRAAPDGGVRLRLLIADHTLKQLPWEYVYLNLRGGQDDESGFLLLDGKVSMVRHEPLPHPHPTVIPLSAEIADLKMVIVAAVPKGQPKLDVASEIKNVQSALKDFDVEGVKITTKTLKDATPDDLRRALIGQGSAYILHFAGHGIELTTNDLFNRGQQKEEGYLLLLADKKTKKEARMSADDVAKLLQRAGVRLAVIGACHSASRDARYPWDSIAGALTARDIPAVIAMQYEVSDQHSIKFSEGLYLGLASGLSLDEAVSFARASMRSVIKEGDSADVVDVEWGVPVLYSRLANGVIFPERLGQTTAQALRAVVNQAAENIGAGGKVTGISIERETTGDFKVFQKVETVDSGGSLLGVRIGPSGAENISVTQDLGSVSGTVTGVKIDQPWGKPEE